jgi:DNA-binding transcriptional MerR regulator
MGGLVMIGRAAVLVGASEDTLRNFADRGLVRHTKAGRVRLFREEDLPEIRRVLAEHGRLVEQHPAGELASA